MTKINITTAEETELLPVLDEVDPPVIATEADQIGQGRKPPITLHRKHSEIIGDEVGLTVQCLGRRATVADVETGISVGDVDMPDELVDKLADDKVSLSKPLKDKIKAKVKPKPDQLEPTIKEKVR